MSHEHRKMLKERGSVQMADVNSVAAAILERTGPVDAFKLQKLVYYSQAWHLAWEGDTLFDDRIEAWSNGPVVPNLYRQHRGQYKIAEWAGDPRLLDERETTTIDSVVRFYNKWSGWELSELTHSEPPWKEAREGLAPDQRGHQEITPAAMLEFYGSLTPTS